VNRPRVREGISRVGTEYGDVLLDEVNGRYWHVNRTAALVLDALDEGGDEELAVRRVTETFDTDLPTARRDVTALLDRLRKLGVLE
jgi:hypothetical protein